VLFEPNAYHAISELGNDAVQWSVQSGQSIYSLLYSTETFTTEHPQVIERYLKALVKAEAFVRNDQEESKRIIAERFTYDNAYLAYIWPRFVFEVSLDEELLINMDDEARWAVENSLVPNKTIPNYFKLLYLEGLEKVRPQAIQVIY
jgi:ABC-type nitrate/sulfonate/bicarbonate transport system substrate-binding protein